MISKNRIIIFFILSLLFINGYLFGAHLSSDSLHERTLPKKEFLNPKMSWYNNSEDPIHIDDTGINNWEWARSQPWCRKGDGSWGNPYIIENITIDATSSSFYSAILIENSNEKYFEVKNCTLLNAPGTSGGYLNYGAGIKLVNDSRGVLYNNTCSNGGSSGCGILAYTGSSNITIEKNIVKNNLVHGILAADSSHNITIANNIVANAAGRGIYLYGGCYDVKITRNMANDNEIGGINLINSDDNTVKNNTCVETGEGVVQNYGLYLSGSDSNNIINNIFNNNSEYGIYISSSSNNFIALNNFTDNVINCIYGTEENNYYSLNLCDGTYTSLIIDPDGIYGHTWEEVDTLLPQCSGSGLINDPYTLNDLTFDGHGILYGILIQNSASKSFVISNCTVIDTQIGIQLNIASNFKVLNCVISYLKGRNGQNGGTDLPGEEGGEAYGIQLVNCRNGLVTSNYITEISGGDGGEGGPGMGFIGGRGGDGGSCAGLYCSNSTNLIIKRNTILNVYGGAGGEGGEAISGYADAGDGGDGGLAVGLHYFNSSKLECYENWISSIYGGNGGNGGISLTGSQGGDGGDGGLAVGVQYFNSSNSVSSESSISYIYGGAGGSGGIGFPEGSDGVNDIAVGIYLNDDCNFNNITENIIYENDYGIEISSGGNNNLLFYNYIFNNTINNADDDGQNYWDNGTIGNYWGDYSGIDANYDGIGDTLYDVPGGGGNKDNKPIMNYNPFFFIRPVDSTYEVGTMGLNIEWIVINTLPVTLTFNVFEDGTSIKTGDLYNYINEIVIDVDCSKVGIYGFTIEVADGNGGTYTDSVWITVINTTPIFTLIPTDLSYEIGGVGNNLSWMFSDISIDNPTYTISRNGVPIFIDIPCVSDDPIEISVDGLEVDTYGFTIELNDGYGGTIVDSVWVTVSNTAPVFTLTPTDFSYDIGSTGNSLTWTFSDISTDNPTYTISRNGVPIIIANSCVSGIPIEISVDGLEADIYGFTIEINDGYGGIVLDTVWVTVEGIGAAGPPIGTIIIGIVSFAGGIGAAAGILLLLRKIKGVREVTE